MARMLRWRLLPLPGGGGSVLPWIQIADAASATIAVLENGQPGEIYNVVDAQPARFRDLVAAFADELGYPRPWTLPMWLSRRLIPYATRSLASTRLIVSNQRAKERWVGPLSTPVTWTASAISFTKSKRATEPEGHRESD